ncbi:MAG: colanic acid biosynthesis glycosyltransferase WcaL [Verrucomicrobiales bacterium]|nr:colanic acid biosynthesis glycosyltransferase WcaL [Verrucomicrobiales bacterium]
MAVPPNAVPSTSPAPAESHSPPRRPRLVSLCGTWLKPEMQSLYRQATHLQRWDNTVFTEQVLNAEQFPFDPVIIMERRKRPRPRGNFILRFWYKHIVRQWPPPRQITIAPEYHPYNLPDLLAAHQPDLVHVYYGHKAVKYLDMLLAWGGPFLVSFHGVDVVKFTEDPAYTGSLRRVFTHARLILARSQSLLEALRALGCPPDKLRLNHTPIPLDRFPASVREAPAGGAWRLIQASRLIPKKGLFTTLEALRLVVPHVPDLKFIVCGTGPVKEEFLRRRDELGLASHVKVLGWLDQEALLAEYQRAHLFLHPSELTETADQEGIPNAMLEAMATGLPVVATRHGGIPEAVTDGTDGLLVPERSPQELADALLTLLRNPALLTRFSEAAAATVRARFGLPAAVAKLEDCYDEARASATAFAGTGADQTGS